MTTILKTRNLWKVVEDGVPNKPTQTNETPEILRLMKQWEETSTKDLMAMQILQTAVSDQIFSRIASAITSKEAWDALKSEYQGSPQVRLINLQSLRREYENLKMNDDDNIKVFTEKLIDLGNQLRIHGEEKTDYQIVQKILISLPARFDSIVAVMEQTKDLTSLPVTELIGTLKAHEKRVSSRDESMTEGALYAHSKGKKWCDYCKRRNHTEAYCWKKAKDNDPCKTQCYNCGELGHYSKECRSKKKEQARVTLEEEEDSCEDHMLFCLEEEGDSSEDHKLLCLEEKEAFTKDQGKALCISKFKDRGKKSTSKTSFD